MHEIKLHIMYWRIRLIWYPPFIGMPKICSGLELISDREIRMVLVFKSFHSVSGSGKGIFNGFNTDIADAE